MDKKIRLKPRIVQPPILTPEPDIWETKKLENRRFIEEYQKEIVGEIVVNNFIAIAFFACTHLGNNGTDMDLIEEFAGIVKSTPNMYAALMGDLVDNFISQKILSALINKSTSPSDEEKLLKRMLDLFGDKILLSISGNHENFSKHISGIDKFKDLFKNRQIAYARDEFRLKVKAGKNEYKIGMRHRYNRNSSINITHAPITWLRFGDVEYDAVIIAHNHEPSIQSFYYRRKKKVVARVSTFKVADVHNRNMGYNDAVPIMPCIVFSPEGWDMTQFDNINRAAQFLGMVNK